MQCCPVAALSRLFLYFVPVRLVHSFCNLKWTTRRVASFARLWEHMGSNLPFCKPPYSRQSQNTTQHIHLLMYIHSIHRIRWMHTAFLTRWWLRMAAAEAGPNVSNGILTWSSFLCAHKRHGELFYYYICKFVCVYGIYTKKRFSARNPDLKLFLTKFILLKTDVLYMLHSRSFLN